MLTGMDQGIIHADTSGHYVVEIEGLQFLIIGKWVKSQWPVTLINIATHLLLILVGDDRQDRTKDLPLQQEKVFLERDKIIMQWEKMFLQQEKTALQHCNDLMGHY